MSSSILPVDAYAGQDFYVPSFQVRIRDENLDSVVIHDVLSVTYTDSINEIDSFDLTVNNWDPGQGQGSKGFFKYSDGELFAPWQDVELWMGYIRNGQSERRQMLVGEITTMTPNFPGSAPSTLKVTGLNLLHRFRTKQITRTYTEKKDSEVFEALVGEIRDELGGKIPGLTLELDSGELGRNKETETKIQTLKLDNEYPVKFLFTRAYEIGYELTMDEDVSNRRKVTFHYRPPHYVVRPTYVLELGKSLMSFQPSFKTAQQVDKVIVRAWNPAKKEAFRGEATRAQMLELGLLDPAADLQVRKGPLAERTETVVDSTIQSQEEANQVAQKRMRQIAQGLVTGRGKTIGLPDLRAGVKIDVRGLGSRFSGVYYVEGTTHSLGDGGYTTDFTARMEEKSSGAQTT